MEYPLYRKYSNERSYFKVESDREFIQLQRIGKRVLEQRIVAKRYPELLLIRSLISMEEPHIILSNQSEFENTRSTKS